MSDIVRDDWRNIPNSILTLAQQQDAAKKWEEEQRRQLAESFAAQQRQMLTSQLSSLGLQVDDTNQNFVLPTAAPISSRPTSPDSLAGAPPVPPPSGAPASDSPIESIPWSTADQLPKGVKLVLPGGPGPIANNPRSEAIYGANPTSGTDAPAASTPPSGAKEVADYVRQAAQKRNINPEIPLQVIQSEGGFDPARWTGDQGSSFGPGQLHYGGVATGGNAVPGLGDTFTQRTGLDARDPNTWRQQIDFMLDEAKSGGWSPWHGWKGDPWAGIGEGSGKPASAGKDFAGGSLSPNQFGDNSLSADEAMAACGPAAAVAFARANGRNPTLREALDLAKGTGWTADGGMNGVGNQKALLDKMGIPAELDTQPTWLRIKAAVQAGQVTAISTPAHYFVADDYDADTGKLHVGASGTAFRNGAEWMTPEQIVNLGGTVNGALFTKRTTERLLPYSGDQAKAPTSEPSLLDRAGQAKDAVVSAASDLFGQWQNGPIPGSAPKTNAERMRETQQPILDAARADYQNNPGTADQIASNVQQTWDNLPNPGDAFGRVAAGVGQSRVDLTQVLNRAQQLTDELRDPKTTPQRKAEIEAELKTLANDPKLAENPMQSAERNPMLGTYTALGQVAAGAGAVAAAPEMFGAVKGPADVARRGVSAALDPQGAVFQGAGKVLGAGERVAADAARPAAQAIDNVPTGAVDNAVQRTAEAAPPAPDRFYHGTGGGYAKPDPSKFDDNGLFGPAYYLTSDARVASSYATTRAEDAALAQKEVARLQHSLDTATPEYREANEGWIKDQIKHLQNTGGANLRPVDVPPGMNILDAETPIPLADARRIQDAVRAKVAEMYPAAKLDGEFGDLAVPKILTNGDRTGQDVYESLIRRGWSKPQINEVLQQAGFDGVHYDGGKRIPMQDGTGQNIEHTALAIFPQALPKVRNAFTQTAGGQASTTFAMDLAGGAAGGIAGSATTPDDASPLERAGRIAGGAALGAGAVHGLGVVAAKLGAPSTGSWSGAKSVNPTLKQTATMLQAGPPVADEPSLVEKFVSAWTNRNVGIDRFQQNVIRQAGRAPATNEKAAQLIRLNATPRADELIRTELGPAVQAAGGESEALAQYLIHKNNVDVAQAMNAPNRQFSGGFTAADSQQALQDLATEMGPQKFKAVEDAAKQVYQFADNLRQDLVSAGVFSQQFAADLKAKYPNWVPTRILDYMDDPQGLAVGKSVSLRDRGLHSYTEDGTVRFRENPLQSLIDLAHQTEARALKNAQFQARVNLDKLLPQAQRTLRSVPTTYAPTKAEVTVEGFVNGVKQRFVTDAANAATVQTPAVAQMPGFIQAVTSVTRALATSLSPAFALVRNPTMDIPEYFIRESVRAGGNPLALPRIVVELAKSYAEALNPVLMAKGDPGRRASAFLLAGGGQSGMIGNTFAARKQAAQALNSKYIINVTSVEGAKQLMKDLLTLKPVTGLAERVENAPRSAAFNLAQRRGADQVDAAIAGRTVTLDFGEGGTLAKAINQVIPFFNVGIQGTATLGRAAKENPVGFGVTMATLVGAPTIAEQAWNRSDKQRSADYDDVPQYLKDSGLIFMLPADPQTDAQGNRRPQYIYVPLRTWAPFVNMARQAAESVIPGGKPQEWQDLLGAMVGNVSPLRANSIGDVPGTLVPPVIGTGAQLADNKDWFRGSTIASKYRDEQSTETSKALAKGITALAKLMKPDAEVRPSQVEFTIKDIAGGTGASALAASDMAMGAKRPDQRIQTAPVLGGIVGGIVRDQGGEQLRQARDKVLTPSAQKLLADGGVKMTPAAVDEVVGGYKDTLRQAELTKLQQLTNRYVDEAIHRLAASAAWTKANPEYRKQLTEDVIQQAKSRAESELLKSIPLDELQRRRAAAKQTATAGR